jgi:queuosine precursor transporter
MKSLEMKTNLLLGIFVACIVIANLLGNKITTLFGVRTGVGIFIVPILFLITDIIEEVHGKKKAKLFVYVGLVALLFTLFFTFLAIALPPEATWGSQEAYEDVFGVSIRIMIASFIAFFISQVHDVWAFSFWKKKTNGKHLWLRNNLSTAVSQLIDTTIFMFIAFYQITPKFDVSFVISIIIPYYLLKVLFSIFDTPFVYLGVKWMKK